MSLIKSDPEIYNILSSEENRQQNTLSLIASENIASKAVREIVGSVFTNKYAEGYPHKRYYGGCQFNDEVELLAIQRAMTLFNASAANVQPHCGSSANFAVYFALANVGDCILAMDLDHGGHLTHGAKVNFSGKLFNFVHYGVNKDTYLIDYEQVEQLAILHKPKIIIAGASAYSRHIDFARFRKIADACNAYLLVDMAHVAGLVAAKLHPSPIDHAHVVTSTTHKTLRGPRGGLILCNEDLKKKIDSLIFPGLQGGPLMHEIAAKAVCFFEALQPSFVDYQKNVIDNAKYLAKSLIDGGMSVLTGGTDNHLVLVNLQNMNLTGKEAEKLLDEIGIIANKNKIPYDPNPPTITSGIRLGTPSITTRGMGIKDVGEIAQIILDCLFKRVSTTSLNQKVIALAKKFKA